jgi:hypothetical protein
MVGMSRLRRLVDAGRTLGPARLTPSRLRWTVRREFVVFARDLRVPAADEVPAASLPWTDLFDATAPLLMAIDPALDDGQVERARGGKGSIVGSAGGATGWFTTAGTRPALPTCRTCTAGTGPRTGTC